MDIIRSEGSSRASSSSSNGQMAVIGVTRNIRLRRRGASGFGFSLRGGREYAAGFYVSEVQPGGEAHKNGLRVGDKIIRVNGFPVEDAVHHEVALLAKNQQVLVLKVRSVGVIPVKDNPNDPVTWHMIQQQQHQHHHHHHHHHQQQQQQPLPPQPYCDSHEPTIPYNEVRIRIMVGEKGKLGCGVCKGLVPGLTVQGTREGGPARVAGLKAGDIIVWCNGQILTDLPFEKSIEIMRSAAILDLIINRPIPVNNGLYDCPETLWMRGSNTNTSESPNLITNYPRNDIRRDACCSLALSTSSCSSSEYNHPNDQNLEWTRKPNNTTVIRINQNQVSRGNVETESEPLYDPVPPRDYETHNFDDNILDERNRVKNIDEYNTELDRNAVTTVQVHPSSGFSAPCPPPCPPPISYNKWQHNIESKPMINMGSTISMGSTGSTETESSLESCSGGSSSCCEPTTSIKSPDAYRPSPPPMPNLDLGTAIAQEFQRRAQLRNLKNIDTNNEKNIEQKKITSIDASRMQDNKVAHDKLMEEFKQAHKKMFNNDQPKTQLLDTVKEKSEDAVEMESIESFKLKETPSSVQVPKPPATYFSNNSESANINQASTGVATKVAVKIGTYEGDIKQPAKLDFLNQQHSISRSGDSSVSRFQNELVATLQRSNLKKKTEDSN